MSPLPHINIQREESSYAGRCVHYAGRLNAGEKLTPVTHCEAGVAYDSVEIPVTYTYSRAPWRNRYTAHVARPCFKYEHGLTNGCPHCRFPTPEEVKAKEEEWESGFRKTMAARKAITDHIGYAKGVSGTIPCPVCTTGTLSYTRAASNGHIHARCSTEGCVAWME